MQRLYNFIDNTQTPNLRYLFDSANSLCNSSSHTCIIAAISSRSADWGMRIEGKNSRSIRVNGKGISKESQVLRVIFREMCTLQSMRSLPALLAATTAPGLKICGGPFGPSGVISTTLFRAAAVNWSSASLPPTDDEPRINSYFQAVRSIASASPSRLWLVIPTAPLPAKYLHTASMVPCQKATTAGLFGTFPVMR